MAIRESGLKREELYLTTKYDGGGNIREEIEKSLKKVCPLIQGLLSTLNLSRKLGVSYVDLYLIHAPFVVKDIGAAWTEFEKIKADGLAK